MNAPILLIAEDNPDDRLLFEYAWSQVKNVRLMFVEDGEEAIDFLMRKGKYTQIDRSLYPGLILLDLRMPRKNGFEVLAELKSHPDLKSIPVVVITTSNSSTDIDRAYHLGANSYICKPQTMQEIIDLSALLNQYWFSTVCLPA